MKMSIEQLLTTLITALDRNTAAITEQKFPRSQTVGGIEANMQPAPAPFIEAAQAAQAVPAAVVIAAQAAPAPVAQQTPPPIAAAPVQSQQVVTQTQPGIVPQAAAIPPVAAQVTPGAVAQTVVESPSNPEEYGLEDLRAEVLAKYNETNRDPRVTDLIQLYGQGNVSKIEVEQYANFLGQLRAITL